MVDVWWGAQWGQELASELGALLGCGLDCALAVEPVESCKLTRRRTHSMSRSRSGRSSHQNSAAGSTGHCDNA